MKPALLAIDLQNKFFSGDQQTVQSLEQSVAYINSAIGMFRGQGLPVIFVQQLGPEEGMVPGQPGFGISQKINELPTDLHIHKQHGNSFYQTGLADRLREMKTDTVFISGYCAEHCVLSTYRGAQDEGFAAILIRGAMASPSHENIRFVECISDVVSVSNLKYLLSEGSVPQTNRNKNLYCEAQ